VKMGLLLPDFKKRTTAHFLHRTLNNLLIAKSVFVPLKSSVNSKFSHCLNLAFSLYDWSRHTRSPNQGAPLIL
jgi:hypothetical protein